MIAQLTGTLARSEANSVVLDVGGVGYQVFVPTPTFSSLPEVGGKLTLLTHLIVREDDLSLYGFSTGPELAAFKLLLGASGVGPKVALALLSTLDVSEMARALSTSDTRSITRVPGVGPKLAQRLCLELGDKMAIFAFDRRADESEAGPGTAARNAAFEDVIDGLAGLGYSRADARRAAERAIAASGDAADTGALISSALQLLNGARK